jgi:DNA-binding response OmpR family regulator
MNQSLKSMLLVEDDPDDVALFRRALTKAGISVDLQLAEDGDSAIQLLQSKSESSENSPLPWILLLDLKMPRKSGWEVLKWIRRHPALHRMPVVIFTSSKERSDILRSYELGANSYLVKPVGFDQLKEMVRSMHHYWMDLNEEPEIR